MINTRKEQFKIFPIECIEEVGKENKAKVYNLRIITDGVESTDAAEKERTQFYIGC